MIPCHTTALHKLFEHYFIIIIDEDALYYAGGVVHFHAILRLEVKLALRRLRHRHRWLRRLSAQLQCQSDQLLSHLVH